MPSEQEENGEAVNAGDKLFVDYTGNKLWIYPPGEQPREVEVFVAILGCSLLTYVEAVESQRKEDFITACENAFYYYGGVPPAIVPDNLKSAVTTASRYEAVLNRELTSLRSFSSSWHGIVCKQPLCMLRSSVRSGSAITKVLPFSLPAPVNLKTRPMSRTPSS